MRVCLMIEGQEGVTWSDWVALAEGCERHGLEGLFRSDHYTTIVGPPAEAHDAWATLAALAALTTRIRLGTLVSPATFRHPSVLARMAATVDHVSGGRLEVGMGAGWYEREHAANGFPFEDARRRFARFAEQVEIVVRSWIEDRVDHQGALYELRAQQALPKPLQRPHPPLILGGGVGPRLAALAARFAQEVNSPFATLDQCRARRAALDRACAAAGRDPETLPFSLMTPCVVGESRGEVRDRLRRTLELRGDRRDPDEVLRRQHDAWLVGTVEEVAGRLEQLRAAGVRRVFLQHLDHADLDLVALVGRRLVPAVSE
jgi:F420-dependent oxidoreductase-like protein